MGGLFGPLVWVHSLGLVHPGAFVRVIRQGCLVWFGVFRMVRSGWLFRVGSFELVSSGFLVLV